MMADRFRVELACSQHVTAMKYPAATANRAGVTLILGHGAGANQTSGFMVAFASALAERGIETITFNFLYSEHGRRIPDPNARLESCWRAVIEAVRARVTSNADRLAIGGKSMGGRIASQVAADGIGDLAGLIFLGYPLHPPGRPTRPAACSPSAACEGPDALCPRVARRLRHPGGAAADYRATRAPCRSACRRGRRPFVQSTEARGRQTTGGLSGHPESDRKLASDDRTRSGLKALRGPPSGAGVPPSPGGKQLFVTARAAAALCQLCTLLNKMKDGETNF
jgi:pimeloyl-ACP methyl ester carboxylesterase